VCLEVGFPSQDDEREAGLEFSCTVSSCHEDEDAAAAVGRSDRRAMHLAWYLAGQLEVLHSVLHDLQTELENAYLEADEQNKSEDAYHGNDDCVDS
jgi:hypothetical protein